MLRPREERQERGPIFSKKKWRAPTANRRGARSKSEGSIGKVSVKRVFLGAFQVDTGMLPRCLKKKIPALGRLFRECQHNTLKKLYSFLQERIFLPSEIAAMYLLVTAYKLWDISYGILVMAY